MEDSLTCCLGTPWWAAGRCLHPGPHCWHCPHSKFLSPEPGCLPSASHFPQYEVGNCTGTATEWKKIWIQFVSHANVNVWSTYLCMDVCVLLPDGKHPAEVIHDVVELNLQVLQDIAGLHTQLKHVQRNTHTPRWMQSLGKSRKSNNDINWHIWITGAVWTTGTVTNYTQRCTTV